MSKFIDQLRRTGRDDCIQAADALEAQAKRAVTGKVVGSNTLIHTITLRVPAELAANLHYGDTVTITP